MKYYKIHFTLSTRIRGNSNYIKDYKFKIPPVPGQVYWEVPKFVGNIYNEKIDFDPYLLDIELFANAKLNDLIMEGGPVSGNLIMSGKLKAILEKYRETGLQFFNINIIKRNEFFTDYWLLNMYEFNHDYIDFERSLIIYEKHSKDYKTTYNIDKVYLQFKNFDEFKIKFNSAIEKNETIYIEKLILKEELITEDFFMLKHVFGGNRFVSEKLKQEIEQAGCTGIEFQPSELSYNEWVAPSGEREKIYGKI